LRYFYEIFSVCTCQQVAFKFLVWLLLGDKQPSYDDFSAVGAFSLKFSVAPNGENTDRIKKVRGVQKWDGAAGGVSIPACWAPASLIRPTPKKTPVA